MPLLPCRIRTVNLHWLSLEGQKAALNAVNAGPSILLHKETLSGHTRPQVGENNSAFLKWACEKTFHTFHLPCKVIDEATLPKENPRRAEASKGSKASRLSLTAAHDGICCGE